MKGPIARGTIRTSFVLGLRLVVQAGTLLLVARMLGTQQFGAFAGVASLAVILGTLSGFGIHLVLLREVARDPRQREEVFPYAVPTTLLFGSVLLAIYLLICTLMLHEASVPFGALLVIGASETILQPLFSLPATEHLALGRISRSQLLMTLPLALRLLAAIAIFTIHPADPLISYAYGYLFASLIALALVTLTMPAPWPRPAAWRLPVIAELRDAAGYAVINLTKSSPTELDKTLAIKLLPLASAGIYAAGTRVIGAMTLPVIAMMLSALPRLFRGRMDQHDENNRLLGWIFASALCFSAVLTLALWVAAPVFDWLFGAQYQGLAHTIRLLCFAVPGMALRTAAGYTLMAQGHPWLRTGFEAIGLCLLVATALLLVPRLPNIGMPLALIISELSMATLGWLIILKVIILRRATTHKTSHEAS